MALLQGVDFMRQAIGRTVVLALAAAMASVASAAVTMRTTLFAANCPDRSDWQQEPDAEGPPDSDGQDGNYAQVIRGIVSSQELTSSGWVTSTGGVFAFDDAAWRVSALYINVRCRFDTSSSGNAVRMRVFDTVPNTASVTPTWSQSNSDDAVKWRFAGDGWDIAGLRSSWTNGNVRDLDCAVRRESGSTQLRVDAIRLIVEFTLIDADGDGVADVYDNCPNKPNADQADSDGDGIGNACDNCPSYNPDQGDRDSDGIPDACDNCPDVANPAQVDWDSNGIGDVCDDFDHDGVLDAWDNCRTTWNPDQADLDNDGIGDACADFDQDGVLDAQDNCRTTWNPDQADSDGDGVGNVCDNCPSYNPDQGDRDGDGIPDACDNCRDDRNPDQSDLDNDGIGDACDSCPTATNRLTDYDWDGLDSACDPDEAILMDKLIYAEGGWSLTQFGETTFGDATGWGYSAGRRASGGGSTSGGFAAASMDFEFDAEDSLIPQIRGSMAAQAGAMEEGISGGAFVRLKTTLTVLQPRYYRMEKSGGGSVSLTPPYPHKLDSKHVPPGDYQFDMRISSSTYSPGESFGSVFIEFLKDDPCPADINADGQVDDADFVIFVAAYDRLLVPDADARADFNHDQLVDDLDFVLFVIAYDVLVCP